jgi:hypothetical protein
MSRRAVRMKEARRTDQPVHRSVLDSLKGGVSDPNRGVRLTVVRALAHVDPAAQKEVAEVLKND